MTPNSNSIIINLWKEEKIKLCISAEILEGYLEVLSRLGFAAIVTKATISIERE